MAENKSRPLATPFIAESRRERIWPQMHFTPEQQDLRIHMMKSRWPEQGLCKTYHEEHPDEDLWAGEKLPGRPATVNFDAKIKRENMERVAKAKRLCIEECPVVVECREYAVETNEPWGIWGGLDQEERKLANRNLRRRRGNALNGRTHDDKGRWVSNS